MRILNVNKILLFTYSLEIRLNPSAFSFFEWFHCKRQQNQVSKIFNYILPMHHSVKCPVIVRYCRAKFLAVKIIELKKRSKKKNKIF